MSNLLDNINTLDDFKKLDKKNFNTEKYFIQIWENIY